MITIFKGKFNEVRFQRVPIVIVDGGKPKKIKNKIEQPEQEVVSDGNSKFRKKFFEHHAIFSVRNLVILTITNLDQSMRPIRSNLLDSYE